MMTVLWVTFGLPYPPDCGVRMRDFHLIREVSKMARIVLFSLVPSGGMTEVGELRGFCDRIETWPMPDEYPPLSLLMKMPVGAWRNFYPDAAARIRSLALTEQPDVIQIEHSLLAGYLDAVPTGSNCRTVLSLHNVAFAQYRQMARLEQGLGSSLGYFLKSWLMRRTEKRYIARFNLCVTVSRAERDSLKPLLPRVRMEVIENGVDCAKLQPSSSAGATLIFAGVFFCRSILPTIREQVPDVRLIIAGHAPPQQVEALAFEKGVTVTGYVPDIRPWYAKSSVTVVPLRAGGGTRLKILESMALGRPVVSTSMGCEGLEVQHGVHLLVADNPLQFASCVTRLLLEPALRDKIAGAARLLMEQRYDWPEIGGRLAVTLSAP